MSNTAGRFVVMVTLRKLLRAEGFSFGAEAKKELDRVIENICMEALFRVKMTARKRIQAEDIRRCPTCDRDRDLGPLKL